MTSITKFGAFVQAAEGVEGMVHVSEISAEKTHQSSARRREAGAGRASANHRN